MPPEFSGFSFFRVKIRATNFYPFFFLTRTGIVRVDLYNEGGKEVSRMGTAERRREIMKILCRRRSETMVRLSCELGVSLRTIQRDIEALGQSEPIYTQPGKYGGVYVMENYRPDRMYMTEEEIAVLKKLQTSVKAGTPFLLPGEKELLDRLISEYTKPTRKERNLNLS